jgi:hypothetical protein
MDWALHQPEVRFDIHAERAEYERLLRHPARVLQDRLVRLGDGDRSKEIPIAERERLYQKEAQARLQANHVPQCGAQDGQSQRRRIRPIRKGNVRDHERCGIRLLFVQARDCRIVA